MSSYLSNLLTTTSSRYASLRALIPSNSETDGDTEDDTHLCRVLRAYYVEKGRPFPAWLPPDPKAPPPIAMASTVTPYPPIGAGYGGLQQGMSGGAPTSKLGSLWDSQPPPQQIHQPQSLRAGRGVASRSLADGRGVADPYGRNSRAAEPQQVTARPLPSQRAGSVQQGITPPGSSGSGTAQDRLKARLWGAARQASPGPGSQGPSPSLANVSAAATANARNPYAAQGGYDDRSGSFGSSRNSPSGTEKPFMAATAPWASSADEFSGSGYGSGGGYGGGSGYSDASGGGAAPLRSGRVGLPSGPRGGGLPGGPRSTRP